MTLRESKGNMYDFVSHQWNPVKGKCLHDCVYCYVKRFPQRALRLDESELKTFHGNNRFIFVCSGTDLFADNVPSEWIIRVIAECRKYPDNKYLFQSKNPVRFNQFIDSFPQNTILGTTIETNRFYQSISEAPPVVSRALAMMNLDLPKMVTIEPIMDFDVDELASWIIKINPEWVNIGADSNREHKLPEPSPESIKALINVLQEVGIKVKQKPNLKRLI